MCFLQAAFWGEVPEKVVAWGFRAVKGGPSRGGSRNTSTRVRFHPEDLLTLFYLGEESLILSPSGKEGKTEQRRRSAPVTAEPCLAARQPPHTQ